MKPVRRAVIDVGTNSVKVLVADVAGRDVRPVWEESKQTRLGRGFYKTRHLLADAIAATAETVARFAQVARDHQAISVCAIATSAARDAVNADDLISAVHAASGLKLQVISGEREADLAFQGVTSDARFATHPLLLLEVGGGSCQLIIGHAGSAPFKHSFPLGTVRLLEKLPHSNPPTAREYAACRTWLDEFVVEQIRPFIDPPLKRETQKDPDLRFAGTGGTASILACMELGLTHFDRARLEAVRLSAKRLSWHVHHLWSLPLEERQQIPGLPKNRADVILTGAAIYQVLMEHLGLGELQVSTRGLRYAAMMD
jgi:exopolyphosphatase/guanosine-5'-triphosphate,3'-diphosphate pyrophosphatase